MAELRLGNSLLFDARSWGLLSPIGVKLCSPPLQMLPLMPLMMGSSARSTGGRPMSGGGLLDSAADRSTGELELLLPCMMEMRANSSRFLVGSLEALRKGSGVKEEEASSLEMVDRESGRM